MLNPFLAPRICTMLKILTKKLRNQSLNEIQPFQLKISYPPSDEDSDDSEGENQELAQIDRERRRNCTLTPLANNQLQNQENQCCKVRALFHASLDRHSSEEELERINREFAAEKRKWSQVSRLACCSDSNNTSSSDEEVKNLCAMSFRPVTEQADGLHSSPSPVLFSASPPKRLQPLVRSPASRPLIFTSVGAGLEQVMPCKRHRQGYGDKVSRPSLDLEKMQQKMLLKKNCGAKTRVIKIRGTTAGGKGGGLVLCCKGSSDTGSALGLRHHGERGRKEDRSPAANGLSCYRRNQSTVCMSEQETLPCEPVCLCHCSPEKP